MIIEERIQEMAERYACGIGRSDGHGISSFPDTYEMKAYITAARVFYKMGWQDRGDADAKESESWWELFNTPGARRYANPNQIAARIRSLKCPLEEKTK